MKLSVQKQNSNIMPKTLIAMLTLLVILGFVSQALAVKFPHRKDFPTVAPIDSEELMKEYEANNVVIVDVRSEIEFNVIHPKLASTSLVLSSPSPARSSLPNGHPGVETGSTAMISNSDGRLRASDQVCAAVGCASGAAQAKPHSRVQPKICRQGEAIRMETSSHLRALCCARRAFLGCPSTGPSS